MPTDHNIRQLIINKMTDAQYEQAVKNADELYLTPDTGGGGGGSGTVTSVRVQATSPVVSSQNTAQTTTLNTTISLANNYGDTKNPYASKTKNYVLAAPVSANGTPSFRALDKADIPLANETAASGGTTTSLVTTGEKYTWNNKQNALTAQTAYTSKGSATKVPQITTNTLGQVTGITEVDITHPTELPSQSGQSGKFLTTDGSSVSWATVQGGSDIDNSTITKNTNDELQTVGIKDTNSSNTIQIWTGNKSQYDNFKSSNWTIPINGENFGSASSWQDLAYGNGKFVIMSNNGYISTSTDGTDWTAATQNLDFKNKGMTALAYGNGKFVTISANDYYVSTSTDGINWTTPVKNSNLDMAYNDYVALTYSNNKFVALSTDGYISTSTDGTDWTAATYNSNLGDDKQWYSITYGNGMFVALSINGYISTSTDGMNWTEAVLINNLSSYTWENTLAYDGKKFIALDAAGYTSTSIDGTTWTIPTLVDELSQGYLWRNLIYDNDKLVALDMYGGYTSIKYKEIDPNTLYNVIDDGLYLGTDQISSISTGPKFLTFTNVSASTWVSDNTYTGYNYKCVLTCNGVTSSDYAQVIFGPAQSVSGDYANVCLTGTNSVTIYSKVNTAISIPSIVVFGSN